ncbi:MAG: type II secretion system protein [Propionicimonas sp.]
MRATISRYIDALKKRRSSDEGFSLIELIVVVAILGILVAIAIPVFGGLQDTAKKNSIEAIAANAATQVASNLAQAKPANDNLTSAFPDATFVVTGTAIEDYCVAATGKTGTDIAGYTASSGTSSGCTKPGAAPAGAVSSSFCRGAMLLSLRKRGPAPA